MVLSFPPFKLVLTQFICWTLLIAYLELEPSLKKALAGAVVTAMIFWSGLLYWITLFSNAGYIVLCLYLSVNVFLFALLSRFIKSRTGVSVAASAPFILTGLFYLYGQGELAFTWGQPSYSLVYQIKMLQAASLAGSYGITLWLLCLNSFLAAFLTGKTKFARRGALLSFHVLLFANIVYGLNILHGADKNAADKQADSIRVSFVQPSIPQDIKWETTMKDSVLLRLENLSLGQQENKPRLVVWPEAAVPAYLRTDRFYQNSIGAICREMESYILTGAPDYSYGDSSHTPRGRSYETYNSAFMFDPDGKITANYAKMILVPISERMPWEQHFEFLRRIDVGGSHFMPGKKPGLIPVDNDTLGVLICFESAFPDLSRSLSLGGAKFLVNITNDAWFERSSAVYQHSSFLVLRAIENRRAVVRSANTGISAFYDRYGRRHEASMLYDITAATADIELNNELTFYTRHGDWPAVLSILFSLFLLAVALFPDKVRRKIIG